MTPQSTAPPDWLLLDRPPDTAAPAVTADYELITTTPHGTGVWAAKVSRTHIVDEAGHLVVAGGLTLDADPARVLHGMGADLSAALPARPLRLVGHFAAVSVADGEVRVVTDHVGSVPVYCATSADGRRRAIGTNLDHVSVATGRREVDRASALELVRMGIISSPATIYRGVGRLGPGAVLTVPAALDQPVREEPYWTPPSEDPDVDLAERARELPRILRANIAALLAHHPRPMLQMSGGEDSRTLARVVRELLPPGEPLPAVVFLDQHNREWRLAKAAARLIGVEIEARLREPDHYTADMSALARVTLPGLDLSHAHSIGLLGADEADIFLDGYTADMYYKATFQSVRWRQIGEEPEEVKVSLDRLDHSRTSTVAPTWPGTDVGEEVAARRAARREHVGRFRLPRSVETWAQGWPISDRATYPYFSSNWRSRPSASPFMFGNMLQAVAPVPEDLKVNRALFHRAFRSTLGLSGWVPRSGGQVPALGGRPHVATAAVIRSGSIALTHLRRRPDPLGQGPWQTDATIHSALDRAFDRLPEERVRAAEALALGGDPAPGGPPVARDHWTAFERQRILQLAVLLGEPG